MEACQGHLRAQVAQVEAILIICAHSGRAGPAPEDPRQELMAVAGPCAQGRVTEPLLLAGTGLLTLVSHQEEGSWPQTLPSPAKGLPASSASKVPAAIQSNQRKQMSLYLTQSLHTAFSPFSWCLSLTPGRAAGNAV